MVNYEELADYIIMKCNKDGKEISNLKLQKMIFYCQAYHIAKYKERLIDCNFEAWKHGAVLPALYHDYCSYGYSNINIFNLEKYNEIIKNFGEYLIGFLDKIIDKFSSMSADAIRTLNHNEEPWKRAREGYLPSENCNKIIDEELMNKYYSQLLYEEDMKNMELKKPQKISIKNKELIRAKNRLSQRQLYKITEENKEDYYENIINNYNEFEEYTWRAMNGR